MKNALGIKGEGFNKALGRWEVYVPNSRRGARQQVLRYRYVMEQHIGRPLNSDEHVHHINEDPTDDRLENLQLMSAFEHNSLHAKQRWVKRKAQYLYAWSRKYPCCQECGTTERPFFCLGFCRRCYNRRWYRQRKQVAVNVGRS